MEIDSSHRSTGKQTPRFPRWSVLAAGLFLVLLFLATLNSEPSRSTAALRHESQAVSFAPEPPQMAKIARGMPSAPAATREQTETAPAGSGPMLIRNAELVLSAAAIQPIVDYISSLLVHAGWLQLLNTLDH